MTAVREPVTILGGGVAGLCIAAELTGRGVAVSLHDIAGAPGPHGCSWWAGGMLAPLCEGETAPEPVRRLGAGSAAWWARYTAVTQAGTLVVAAPRDRGDLRAFARRTQGHKALDGAAIAALEPDLGTRFAEGLHFPSESHLDPRLALADLRAALGRGGAALLDGPAPPRTTGLRIDCRGLAARDVLPDLRGVRGEMLMLRCPGIALGRPVRLLHPRLPLYVVPRGDGVFMLGATMIEAEDRALLRVRSAMDLLNAAFALVPAFAEAEILEMGVDLRPAYPDNLPRLRRRGDTIHANGLYRHGYLMAPVLARQLADWLLEGRKPELTDDDHGEW